jgi:hypothetical protein
VKVDPNLPLLEEAAAKLKSFLDEIVFVGGVTLGLLITDSAGASIRGTNDVDIVAEILTYPDYIAFSARLLAAGFLEDGEPGAPLCRWRHGSLILDVLPLDKEVLGYTNIWYRSALDSAQQVTLPGGLRIKAITAPFFLGTKMEAFRGRGKNDYIGSHDIEDFVSIVDGRSAIVAEVAASSADLCKYLAAAAGGLLRERRFLEVLPGFVYGDAVSQERVPLIEQRLRELSQLA